MANNSKQASALPQVYSAEAQPASATALFENSYGNVYGFYAEDNGSADKFVCFYDIALAASVVPGTTPVAASYRVKADQGFGKSAEDTGLHHFKAGCAVLIADNRDGSSPASGDTLKVWHK